MSNKDLALKLENVSFKYSNAKSMALKDINLELSTKCIAALLGPNGAGKSTLIKAILGLLKVEGQIEIFGKHLDSQINKIGYVPQRFSFNSSIPITVSEFLSLALLQNQLSKQQVNNQIDLVINQVNLKEFKNQLLSNLSGGQLQRILVARALIHNPSLLILDEPEAGIDVGAEHSLFELLKDLRDKHEMTMIIASHELDVVYGFADQVICINKSLVCSGKPQKVMTDKTFKSLYGNDVTFYTHAHVH